MTPKLIQRCPYCLDGRDRCLNDGICQCECGAHRSVKTPKLIERIERDWSDCEDMMELLALCKTLAAGVRAKDVQCDCTYDNINNPHQAGCALGVAKRAAEGAGL